jgi:hypothetical protein
MFILGLRMDAQTYTASKDCTMINIGLEEMYMEAIVAWN